MADAFLKRYDRAAHVLFALCALNVCAWLVAHSLHERRGAARIASQVAWTSWIVALVLLGLSFALLVVSRMRRPLWCFFVCFVSAAYFYVDAFIWNVYY